MTGMSDQAKEANGPSDSARAARWRRVREVFARVLEEEPAHTRDFLMDLCSGDSSLASEVEWLLGHHRAAGSFLQLSVGDPLVELEVPETLGAYRIVREIGEGGMGRVFEAERSDGSFQKLVAVKVLRSNLASREAELRFQAERQILADLEHPNIARLIDGGATESGRPYLVMELVEGVAVDRYAADVARSTTAILRLFRKICAAVHYAHQRLVIHRDIKPTNILVTADGEPKLLDFGIARLLRSEYGAGLPETRGPGPMTPEYASPEQLRGRSITIASDVYSLGVLLYELMAGRRPYEIGSSSPATVAERLESEAVPPPSVAAAGRLPRDRASDLDRIVMRCLHPDPDQRYDSTEQLSADLQRYLDCRPVMAQGDGFPYRVRRFIRRNRWPVGAAAVVFALLVTLIFVLGAQRHRLLGQMRQTAAVTEFVLELFDESDPLNTLGENPTARQILARGRDRIEERLDDQPEIKAALLATLGRIHVELSQNVEARALLEEAVELRRSALGPDHAETATALGFLGRAKQDMGEYDEAASHFQEAIEIHRRLGNAEGLNDTQARLANLLLWTGRFEEARDLLRSVVADLRRRPDTDPGFLARVVLDLGVVLRELGDFDDARASIEQASELARIELGEEHPQTVLAIGELASLDYYLGKYASAESSYRLAIQGWRRLYGDDSLNVAGGLNGLGNALRDQGRLEEALEVLAESAAILDRLYPERDHPILIDVLNNTGIVHADMGLPEEAEKTYRAALEMIDRMGGPETERISTLSNLSLILTERGDFDGAREIGQQALEMGRSHLPPGHPRLAILMNNLALAEMKAGRLDEAAAGFAAALDIVDRSLGKRHVFNAAVMANRARVMEREGRLADAELELRRAMEIDGAGELAQDSPDLAKMRGTLGRVLAEQGKCAEAEELLARAEQALAKRFPAHHISLLQVRLDSAVCVFERGDDDRARRMVAPIAEELLRRYPDTRAADRAARLSRR